MPVEKALYILPGVQNVNKNNGGIRMRYTVYYEENEKISYDKYEQLKAMLEGKKGKKQFEAFHLRKLQFTGANRGDSVPSYYLCVKNRDEDQIYLEKKYMQNGMHYKKCEKLTKEECVRILNADIEWMKDHKTELFAGFYLQVTLNQLSPGRMTDYDREMMKCKKEGYVTFIKKIERAVGNRAKLFEEPEMTISCLDEDKIMVNYKKVVTLPSVIAGMLQGAEEPAEEMAMVF